jgi:hypothetical protein
MEPPISPLEKSLNSYNGLIIFISLFLFILIFVLLPILLGQSHNEEFNKIFGKQIFITLPFLLLIAFLVKELLLNDKSFIYQKFSTSTNVIKYFKPLLFICIFILTILSFFMMLYVGGIFSNNPPKNNTAMILNSIIFIGFIIFTVVTYTKYTNTDNILQQLLPTTQKNNYNEFIKYIKIFIAFILFVIVLYFVNPGDIMTKMGGPLVFFTLFVGFIMMSMIIIYHIVFQDSLLNNTTTNKPNIPNLKTTMFKCISILIGISISLALIYGVLYLMGLFNQDGSKADGWGRIIFNVILLCSVLGMVYKLANAGGFLDKNPYYRLILNTLLYIPCLFVNFVQIILKLLGLVKGNNTNDAFTPPKPFEIKMLILGISLLTSYFLWFAIIKKFIVSTYLKQGGKQLINQPIQTDILTNVSSYQKLSENEKYDYQYALSFWVYIDSFSVNTNNKLVSLLSYGDNPNIKYSSTKNTFYITIKEDQDIVKPPNKEMKFDEWEKDKDNVINNIEKVKLMSFGNNLDTDGNRILYEHPNVELQKWNHLVLNFSGGTLDVFYNGKLVKSSINVVPYMKFDTLTVGSNNGVSGNIANLMYFKKPLDLLTINTLYTSLKNKNPPTIKDNNDTVISL